MKHLNLFHPSSVLSFQSLPIVLSVAPFHFRFRPSLLILMIRSMFRCLVAVCFLLSALSSIDCAGHVTSAISNIPIGSTALNYLKVPHGCGESVPRLNSIGVQAWFSPQFTSVTMMEVPNFTGTWTQNADLSTTLTWLANSPYELNGDSKHFQFFGYFAQVVSTTSDQTTLTIPTTQFCTNSTTVYWNQTNVGAATPPPKILAFKPAQSSAGALNLYGNSLFNLASSTFQASGTSSSTDSTAQALGIAGIVIGSVALLAILMTWIRQPSKEQVEKQHRDWADKTLTTMTTSS